MRATSYSRVSVDDLRERRSVGEQETGNLDAIERGGWTLGGSYVDNDRSASRFATKTRPGFADLMAHIRAGGCDVLVLWESSRGSRTLTEWSTFLDLCRERGVLIHVVTHRRTYDLHVPRDWKTLAEEGVSNAYSSEETRDRVIRAVAANAANGRPHGRLTYGYSREYDGRGRFVRQTIREDQAAVVREIARRTVAGETTSSIVADLNQRQIPTPIRESLQRRHAEALEAGDHDEAARITARIDALRWDLTGLKQLVTNPAYAALRVHRDQVVGSADWPEILTVAEHRKVVAILTDPARRTRHDGAVRHLLTNVARCAECDATLSAQKVRGGRYAYLCSGAFCVSISALWLEPFVEAMLVGGTFDGETVAGRLERTDALAAFAPALDVAELQAAAAEAGALQAELDEAAASVGRPGGISIAMLGRLERDLTARIADARRRATPVTVPDVVAKLPGPGVRERWARYTMAQRRTVVRLLVDVRVQRGRPGARTFDPTRLARSRWVGDAITWGDLWGR